MYLGHVGVYTCFVDLSLIPQVILYKVLTE